MFTSRGFLIDIFINDSKIQFKGKIQRQTQFNVKKKNYIKYKNVTLFHQRQFSNVAHIKGYCSTHFTAHWRYSYQRTGFHTNNRKKFRNINIFSHTSIHVDKKWTFRVCQSCSDLLVGLSIFSISLVRWGETLQSETFLSPA